MDNERLNILVSAAKYDVSCSSSGSNRQAEKGQVGNAAIAGICHSFAGDGRCISLLKILMSNKCVYDCQYCINRRSSDTPRASAEPNELAELVMDFYKRNFIEGLFLSSAIERSPDETMQRLTDTVIILRKVYGFNGYIHLKGIPGANNRLIMRAAKYVDRMSFNIELPSERSLTLLAPQKSKKAILLPMRQLSEELKFAKEEHNKLFIPAGQTTQMIVGASPEKDGKILRLSEGLYTSYKLKRVYFSSYVPANEKNINLPQKPVGLLREHRLYQADWLMRFYGFSANEIIDEDDDLSLDYDPKTAWALKHMDKFPVEINTAPAEELLRVPGIGFQGANRIVKARRFHSLDFLDLYKMRIVMKRASHFITCNGSFAGQNNYTAVRLLLKERPENQLEQLSMFSDNTNAVSVITGEI